LQVEDLPADGRQGEGVRQADNLEVGIAIVKGQKKRPGPARRLYKNGEMSVSNGLSHPIMPRRNLPVIVRLEAILPKAAGKRGSSSCPRAENAGFRPRRFSRSYSASNASPGQSAVKRNTSGALQRFRASYEG
jgi:hypothetical protein